MQISKQYFANNMMELTIKMKMTNSINNQFPSLNLYYPQTHKTAPKHQNYLKILFSKYIELQILIRNKLTAIWTLKHSQPHKNKYLKSIKYLIKNRYKQIKLNQNYGQSFKNCVSRCEFNYPLICKTEYVNHHQIPYFNIKEI